MRLIRKSLLAVASLVIGCSHAAAEEPWLVDTDGPLLAISDIHGAADAFAAILEQVRVIGPAHEWTGGSTHLAVVGDVLDRGPDSRSALDLIIGLQVQARAAGGDVLFVLGNHEIMNLVGDLRYVPAAEYAHFADTEPMDVRARAFERYLARAPEPRDADALESEFDTRFPLGFFAHRAAYASSGAYGAWLLEQPVLLVANRTAFVHGGLSRAFSGTAGEEINGTLKQQLRDYVSNLEALIAADVLSPIDDFYDHPALIDDYAARVAAGNASWTSATAEAAERLKALNEASIFALASPTWYRGMVSCSPLVERDDWAAVLAQLDVDHVVVGHTPTPDARVLSRMDDGILRIDTGMLRSYYGGRAAVLGISAGTLSVSYAGDDGTARPEPQPRRVGGRPGLLTDDELEALLSSGQVVAETQGEGVAQVTIRDGDTVVAARFYPADSAGDRPAVAAYRLDRLLGLGMVPVTVARDVGGMPGSLEYAPPNLITEGERATTGAGGAAWCPLRDQFPSMYVFDVLIYNEGRSADRIAYESESFNLVLLGHDRTFATSRGRPAHLREAMLALTDAWVTALRGLDESRLSDALGDVLNRRQLRALSRRIEDVLNDAANR